MLTQNKALITLSLILSTSAAIGGEGVGLNRKQPQSLEPFLYEKVENATRGGKISIRKNKGHQTFQMVCIDERAPDLEHCQEFVFAVVYKNKQKPHEAAVLFSNVTYNSDELESLKTLKKAIRKKNDEFKFDLGVAQKHLSFETTAKVALMMPVGGYLIGRGSVNPMDDACELCGFALGAFVGAPIGLATVPFVATYDLLASTEAIISKTRMSRYLKSVVKNDNAFKMKLTKDRFEDELVGKVIY